ncbi:hypothetical protein N5P37_001550 [Trichoderma harzianum]|uniref:Uncharacterized protein n=1 Tax=Trichoderma harzianum CBS 226.95 TaxID=983964 RepID=A0A2T4AQU4_TRIHA|nr:hypothetical protein M431DRAFT_2034 [Trichoderma harzianum CBS 226.95]KAK0765613.1 hypothetical protein N5P37_001550 [Trichoderma harzianum]PTB59429.1 hypothetical protein M431DRAFT_2034 [Trichoderma harzianum CBS 226.95]
MVHEYQKIELGETGNENDPILEPRKRKRLGYVTILIIIKDVILVVLALAAAIALYMQSRPTSTGTRCDCGSSTAEARAMGCKYDTIAAAWLPPQCIDSELVAEFEKMGDGENGTWQYWVDAEHSRLLSIDEVGALADTNGFFWTTTNWHFMHCFYYWRKQQRARFTGVLIEPRYDNERHVKHCGQIFKDPGPIAYSYVELKSSRLEEPEFLKHKGHNDHKL